MSERIDPRITAAQETAARVCDAAMASTDEAYRSFIIMLPQNKKVGGGSGASGVYAQISAPYMAINGRIKMARDEHRAQERRLDITISFIKEPVSGHLLCRAVLQSEIHGTVEAHARVFPDGAGVDKTNPLENAESSAIGRGLGFMGYGLFGTGIASAEEVVQAREQAERPPAPPERSMPRMFPPPQESLQEAATAQMEGRQASERQLSYLKGLLERTGTAEADLEAEIARVQGSSTAATERIATLLQEKRQSAVDTREEE